MHTLVNLVLERRNLPAQSSAFSAASVAPAPHPHTPTHESAFECAAELAIHWGLPKVSLLKMTPHAMFPALVFAVTNTSFERSQKPFELADALTAEKEE